MVFVFLINTCVAIFIYYLFPASKHFVVRRRKLPLRNRQVHYIVTIEAPELSGKFTTRKVYK